MGMTIVTNGVCDNCRAIGSHSEEISADERIPMRAGGHIPGWTRRNRKYICTDCTKAAEEAAKAASEQALAQRGAGR